jgi:hypothetical protein
LGELGSGGAGGDLVSFLPTDTYFQSRRIPMNIENLEDLAKAAPKTGKAQVLQLMALRALAEKPDLIKKSTDPAAVLRTIEKIAKGEIARDRLGFSEDYARRTLIALSGKIARPRETKPGDFEEALAWFPAKATLVGILGRGRVTDSTGDYGNEVRKLLSMFVRRPRDWDGFFNAVEMIGNVRMDRIGFACAADGKDKEKDRIFFRITGKGDHQRMVAGLKILTKDIGFKWKEHKDANETPITTVRGELFFDAGTGVAFIGDTDFLLARDLSPKGGDRELKQLFAVRRGKEKSVLKSDLKDRLPRISPETVGLLVGDLPEELRGGVFRQAKLPTPKSILVEALRTKDGVDFRFQAALENAALAKEFAKSIVALRHAGLDGLKRIQERIKNDTPLPRSMVAALRKALESLQIQADGAGVKGTISVPTEALVAPAALLLLAPLAPAISASDGFRWGLQLPKHFPKGVRHGRIPTQLHPLPVGRRDGGDWLACHGPDRRLGEHRTTRA